MMLYHPQEEKIGSQVENAVVKEMLLALKNGQAVKDKVVSYDFHGKVKYAGCAVCTNNYILVLSADQEDILRPINKTTTTALIGAGILALVTALFAYMISIYIVKPLQKIIAILLEVAECKFKKHEELERFSQRKDEVGKITEAVISLRQQMSKVIKEIESASTSIFENTKGLSVDSKMISVNCLDNSATTQQLAASMEETSASSRNIHEQVEAMKSQVDGMST